jgi:glucokinase
VRGEDVTHAAAAGDREALAVLEEVGWWLALGLSNLAAVLDPACFVLGGGLVEASAQLLPSTRRHLTGLLEAGELRPEIPVVAAELGYQAGAIGAGLLAASS